MTRPTARRGRMRDGGCARSRLRGGGPRLRPPGWRRCTGCAARHAGSPVVNARAHATVAALAPSVRNRRRRRRGGGEEAPVDAEGPQAGTDRALVRRQGRSATAAGSGRQTTAAGASPDDALVDGVHGAARGATEGGGEVGVLRHDAVAAENARRVLLVERLQPRLLPPLLVAP